MREPTHLQIGSQVQVRAYKSDGACYRLWMGTIEVVEPDRVVVTAPSGHWVHTVDGGGKSRWAIRKYGYSAEFQQTCYRVAEAALELADNWVAKGMPTVDPG